MKSVKIQIALATVTAILTALLLFGISYILTPHPVNYSEIPTPLLSTIKQIFRSALWIGVAALSALAITGSAIAINRIKQKHQQKYSKSDT
ncbi:hypothetical protein [Candidatus Bathycorpusculum sp.]|uniref:hypothetical protein n=1 Tax=Candidatus Bathycorpusculum sp. TaxID=2994959 RepID=UPI00282B0089|nr:hypothetical protein [Candidatus Termitimicrobium sp.]